MQDGTYTNAIGMLTNSDASKEVDIVCLGDNANQPMDYTNLVGVSTIAQLEGAMEVLDNYYLFDEVGQVPNVMRAKVLSRRPVALKELAILENSSCKRPH